jgi:hypothetical protein
MGRCYDTYYIRPRHCIFLSLYAIGCTGLSEGLRCLKGDYGTALQEWRPLADQGDAWAQFNVGLLYDPVVISQNRPSVADALFFWRMHSRWRYLQIMA